MWWREGVLYQIYPRSFADSDGDGVGDLRGIRERLDHLEWLGVDGIWLNPTFPSPNRDWGYDVADFRGVHPELGTLEDLDALVADARERGMHVVLDLVPNHTSDEHPWFRERRELYVWRAGRDGGPPNNWRSIFGGPAWTRDEATGEWYLHNFLAQQPDLDWWNEEVRREFDAILRFWLDRGIAGLRIDVAHGIVKDRELRDNPQPGEGAKPIERWLGQQTTFNMNRPEVHDVLKRWRAVTDAYDGPERVLIGETWVNTLERLAEFYGSGEDELHLAFNFVFLGAPFDAGLARVVADTEALLPPRSWPVWTLGNHDLPRFPTRWCRGDERRVRAALLLLLCLRGTPVLLYGDEIGMPDVEVPLERMLDPVGVRDFGPERPGRDGARTPMQWEPGPGAGFTAPGVEPWLPLGDADARNVAAQREDPGSVLRLVRDLVALRRATPDLTRGAYAQVPAPAGTWAFRRGEGTLVALRLAEGESALEGMRGEVAIATDRARDGEAVDGTLRLAPWEAVVVHLSRS
jgi:alpha-glucosidase